MSRRFNWMATMGAILPWWSTNKIGGWGLSERQKGLLIFLLVKASEKKSLSYIFLWGHWLRSDAPGSALVAPEGRPADQ